MSGVSGPASPTYSDRDNGVGGGGGAKPGSPELSENEAEAAQAPSSDEGENRAPSVGENLEGSAGSDDEYEVLDEVKNTTSREGSSDRNSHDHFQHGREGSRGSPRSEDEDNAENSGGERDRSDDEEETRDSDRYSDGEGGAHGEEGEISENEGGSDNDSDGSLKHDSGDNDASFEEGQLDDQGDGHEHHIPVLPVSEMLRVVPISELPRIPKLKRKAPAAEIEGPMFTDLSRRSVLQRVELPDRPDNYPRWEKRERNWERRDRKERVTLEDNVRHEKMMEQQKQRERKELKAKERSEKERKEKERRLEKSKELKLEERARHEQRKRSRSPERTAEKDKKKASRSGDRTKKSRDRSRSGERKAHRSRSHERTEEHDRSHKKKKKEKEKEKDRERKRRHSRSRSPKSRGEHRERHKDGSSRREEQPSINKESRLFAQAIKSLTAEPTPRKERKPTVQSAIITPDSQDKRNFKVKRSYEDNSAPKRDFEATSKRSRHSDEEGSDSRSGGRERSEESRAMRELRQENRQDTRLVIERDDEVPDDKTVKIAWKRNLSQEQLKIRQKILMVDTFAIDEDNPDPESTEVLDGEEQERREEEESAPVPEQDPEATVDTTTNVDNEENTVDSMPCDSQSSLDLESTNKSKKEKKKKKHKEEREKEEKREIPDKKSPVIRSPITHPESSQDADSFLRKDTIIVEPEKPRGRVKFDIFADDEEALSFSAAKRAEKAPKTSKKEEKAKAEPDKKESIREKAAKDKESSSTQTNPKESEADSSFEYDPSQPTEDMSPPQGEDPYSPERERTPERYDSAPSIFDLLMFQNKPPEPKMPPLPQHLQQQQEEPATSPGIPMHFSPQGTMEVPTSLAAGDLNLPPGVVPPGNMLLPIRFGMLPPGVHPNLRHPLVMNPMLVNGPPPGFRGMAHQFPPRFWPPRNVLLPGNRLVNPANQNGMPVHQNGIEGMQLEHLPPGAAPPMRHPNFPEGMGLPPPGHPAASLGPPFSGPPPSAQAPMDNILDINQIHQILAQQPHLAHLVKPGLLGEHKSERLGGMDGVFKVPPPVLPVQNKPQMLRTNQSPLLSSSHVTSVSSESMEDEIGVVDMDVESPMDDFSFTPPDISSDEFEEEDVKPSKKEKKVVRMSTPEMQQTKTALSHMEEVPSSAVELTKQEKVSTQVESTSFSSFSFSS